MDLYALILRWFDYWLKGEKNGIMDAAPVRLFVMGANSRLIDVRPDGFCQDLSYGIIRTRFRNGFRKPALMHPGEVYELHVELLPMSNFFQAGHRIRIDISSSDFPNFDHNHNTPPGFPCPS